MTAAVGERPAGHAADLMDAAINGDRQAFGELYRDKHPRVFAFVFRRVGNRQLAEDITADVFAKALAKLDSFTWQGRDPGAWLVTIARNLVADHFKSGRHRLETLLDDRPATVSNNLGSTVMLHTDSQAWESFMQRQSDNRTPESITVDYLTNVALMRAVQQLTDHQRQVIILRFLRGLNVAETAAELGVNIGAVKAMQYRAVRTLERIAPELGDREPFVPKQQRRQRVTCDNCRQPLAGLLTECRRPACLTAVNDLERAVL